MHPNYPLRVWLLLDTRASGGIETHVGTLAAGLRDAGHKSEVLFWADHGPHPLRGRLDAGALPWRALTGSAPALVGALRGPDGPDILHTHGYKAGILGRLAARMAGVPVVSTFHAGEPGRGRVRLYNALDRMTASLADCIAVSEPIRSGLPRSATLIENFVAQPPNIQRTGTPRTVAFVGRLSAEKGPDTFCALARRAPAGISFAMYGDGPMRDGLERAYGDRVRFHGAVPDLARSWPGIGLLCMPSRHEGLPMAALEAMANGVPVAAFAVGALPSLILDGRTGWLAAPGDEDGLLAALHRWAALPEGALAVLSAESRACIAGRFSVASGVAKVLAVYARSVGAARSMRTRVASSDIGPAV